jgi:NTE family protein
MSMIGVVLGAGGVVGHAYHAGVLAALAEATGWDPRESEIIVGTSAGSVVGALLRAGISAPDLAARATGAPLSPEGARIAAQAGGGPPVIPSRPPRRDRGLPRMASPGTFARAALPPFRPVRPGVLAAAALPAGQVPSELVAAGLRPMFPDGWPRRPLWVCAVRLDSGRRTVFGRNGAPGADLADAVAASCAIPGFFEPVVIGGVRYVDGGTHSPTNADLLAGRELDLVIVSSPMSVTGRRVRPSLDLPARRLARLYLGQEAARVRRRGASVLAFQPTDEDRAAMGLNAMDPARREPVALQARESTLRRLERADARDRVELLRSKRAASR